jgi:non-specific serine/threonine protein kinase
MEFADLLRRHRSMTGLTQEELAEAAGLSLRGLSDLERGARRTPYRHTVLRLAEALRLEETDRAALLRASRRQKAGSRAPVFGQAGAAVLAQLSSFVGREREVAEVRLLMEATRLVTLVGVGGVGKTRLALEACGPHLGGVFVDLAPLSDGQLVAAAVAAALGVREQPNHSPLQTLTTHLAGRDLLLVLDNCEHLVAACAELAGHLLLGCPHLRILATSREPLGVAGEQVWPVPPLALSGPADLDPAASEAVRLFTERARLARPDFGLDSRSGPVVAEVCRRLDGLPLAIELAAARLPGLGLEPLAARLNDRFRLLTLSSRTAPRRQQTLRAVIDWSYELLTQPERRLFRRLAVFAGGWSLAMAEEICSAQGLEREDVLDLLSRLVQKSLVLVSDADSDSRYGLLETLRQYAAERLTEADEDRLIRTQHLHWCVGLAEQADADKDGPHRTTWLGALEREHGNLRAALDWGVADPDSAEASLRLIGALGWFWWVRGHAREGSHWMERVLEQTAGEPHTEPATRARAWALAEAGRLRQRQGHVDTALRLLEEALRLAVEVGSRDAEACARLYLGELSLEQGNSPAARAHLETGLALARDLSGHAPAPYRFLHWLGHVAEADEDPAEAAALYAQARELAASQADAFLQAVATRGLASAAIERGDLAAARHLLSETLTLRGRVGNATVDDPVLLAYFARLAAADGQPEQAVRLAAAATALREQTGTQLFRFDRELLERRLAGARRLLTAAEVETAEAEGRAMNREQAFLLTADLSAGPAPRTRLRSTGQERQQPSRRNSSQAPRRA